MEFKAPEEQFEFLINLPTATGSSLCFGGLFVMYWDLILMKHRCPGKIVWETLWRPEGHKSVLCGAYTQLRRSRCPQLCSPGLTCSSLRLMVQSSGIACCFLLPIALSSPRLTCGALLLMALPSPSLTSSICAGCIQHRDKALPRHLEQTLPLNSRCTRRQRQEVTGALSCYFLAGTSPITQIFTR